MSKRLIDVLVFVPLIPAAPVLVTVFLPWEPWLLQKISAKILGPYILYVAFAAWYFGMPWWSVVVFTLWGAVVLAVGMIRSSGKRAE